MSVKTSLLNQLKAWDELFVDLDRLFLPEVAEKILTFHGEIENATYQLTSSVQSTNERKTMLDSLSYLRNLMQSWAEGISRNCVKLEDAKQLRELWQNKSEFLKTHLKDIVEVVQEKTEGKPVNRKNTLFTSNSKLKQKAMLNMDRPFDGSEFLADADDLLAKLATIKAAIPNANTRNAQHLIVIQSSIIPTFSPYVSAEDLRKLGYKADQLGTYVVLHNQILIGVSRKWCRDNGMDTTGVNQLLDNTLKDLGKKNHTKYMRGFNKTLTDIESGYQFIWAISESCMNLFLSGLESKPVDWGLLS